MGGATDIIKKSVLDNFSMPTDLSLGTVLITLASALVLGLFIYLIYRLTFNGVIFARSFGTALILLTMVTAMIIMPITLNLGLALGMVGALSIVRFRTAVKEAMDTVYMFWAVAMGIVLGAGETFYLVGVIAAAGIGLVLYVMNMIKGRGSFPYLLIVRHDFNSASEVAYALHKLPRNARLKSKTVTQNGVEITMELRLPGDNSTLVNDFLRINGVYDATLVSFQGDYGA